MTSPSAAVTAALARWRNNLIDLTRRNPLIFLRPTKSTYVPIARPPLQAVFDRLVRAGKKWSFWQPPVEDDEELLTLEAKQLQARADELVGADLGRRRLLQILTNLYRRALTEYQERGLRILHLACGVLHWREPDSKETIRSPLVLVPVVLQRASIREPFLLAPVEDDPYLNPALQLRLGQDCNLQLPPLPDDWEDQSLTDYLAGVQKAIEGLAGWRVEDASVLTLFSFFKGVMYNDLEANAALLAGHPLVRALAGEAVGDQLTGAELPDEAELDEMQPPEKTFHILDADSSQRLCLEAAARGHSFVMQGPPGTGKSQTIANLIADCLANGKKVLFVSEKMAALEVVYKRLRQVGLGDYCLELHSHKANKREVVAELQRCLEERRRPDATTTDEEYSRLRQRREHLNRYVTALHAVREPLQRSLWSALGELARYHVLPTARLALAECVELTPAWLEQAKQAVQRLGQLWPIEQQGQDFPWWGFRPTERYTQKLRDEMTALLERLRKGLERLQTVADQYGAQLGARGPVGWLLKAADLLEASPAPPASWLTATDLPELAADLERCAEDYRRRSQTRGPLTERYGPSTWQLAEGTASQVQQSVDRVAPLLAPGDDKHAGLLTHQQQLRGWAADTQRRIPGWLSDARTLEKWLNVTLPQGIQAGRADSQHDPSVYGLRRLLRLANLCMTDNPPERSWITDAKVLAQVRSLIDTCRPVFAACHQRKADLLQRYTERFFELDLEYLAERFQGFYSSWLRFFSLPYRRDRRAIARRSRAGAMPATIRHDVLAARDLLQEQKRVEQERPRRQGVLGRYEKGLHTDFDAAERATRVAEDALAVAAELDCTPPPDKLIEAVSAAGAPPEKMRAAAKRLHDTLGPWLHATDELKAHLPAERLPGTDAPLEESALSALNQYAKDLQTALNHFAALTDPVLTRAAQRPADAVALVTDLEQAEQLRREEAGQESAAARWTTRFGPAFQGVTTDWTKLRKMLTWTMRLRELFVATTSALPEQVVHCSGGSASVPSSRELRHAHEQLEQALHVLENHFEPPAPLLGGKRLRDLPLDDLKKRVQEMRDRVVELRDWLDWRELHERFVHLGLGTFWDEARAQPPTANQLSDLFAKAVLTHWVEDVMQREPVLREFRRPEHEQFLAEFRDLDRRLLHAAAQRVGNFVAEQRPQAAQADPGSEIAVLLREAHKKSRHLPIRRLFEQIPQLLLQLKPCLLMSPLSVSQFLPAQKLSFDHVVFDEASQIFPEDAVGALVRGRQVVIAGDDKQLPPTTFFQQVLDDEEDDEMEDEPASFESILDAALGAGLSQRLLRWHYRSRHEALITFSNQRFYDNRLITFPSPWLENPKLGVEFKHVPDGVYDRGGRRDNRREAEVVADLVLEHFRKQPDKSLGVIAFSQAQMTAIQDAVDSRRQKHPELETFFKDDRLEGFFVKNLETVQGDERDVILFSVGYGRDAQGRLTMHFGPVNRQGGERRLNVAVTRAREKLILVSSIRAQDLDVSATEATGVQYFCQYLDYAERGITALELAHPQGTPDPDSPLELDVMGELRRSDYEVVPQVGCSGFRIDLGVVDPASPGRFLLGIECDGVSYHATPTARDRDRLRQEVLERQGWRIHRIWSIDWFYRRAEEVERLRQALEGARVAVR